MRQDEIKLGETYSVRTPEQIASDHPLRRRLRDGERFDLTVTEVGARLGEIPAVRGVRVKHTNLIRLALTIEQKMHLGLPAAGHYYAEGWLFDERGRDVERPDPLEVEELTVPTRWLRIPTGKDAS